MKGLHAAAVGAAMVGMLGVAGVAGAAGGSSFGGGGSLVAIQLTHGVANFADDAGGGYITTRDHSDIGAQVQIWRFYSPDYALTVSGGIGFFTETEKPGTGAPPGSTDFKYTQKSWQARLGADRVIKLSDKLHLFVGPGIQYWSGHAKTEGGAAPIAPAAETPTTNRLAVEGRVGFHLMLKEKVALFTQIGQYLGYATSKKDGAETTWWPSGHDGAAGLAFSY